MAESMRSAASRGKQTENIAELAKLNRIDCVLLSDQHQQLEEQRPAKELASSFNGFYRTISGKNICYKVTSKMCIPSLQLPFKLDP